MSGPVIGAIVKVVGVALSAKSVYEGVKEGNILQAVIGGVGAFYGINSLMAGAAKTSLDAAAQAGIKEGAKNAVTGANMADAAAAAGVGQGSIGSSVIPQALGGEGANIASNLMEASGSAYTGAGSLGYGAAQAPSFLDNLAKASNKIVESSLMDKVKSGASSVAKFANDNPAVVQSGLTLAGGYMQGKAQDKLMDEERRLYDESLARRGAAADVGAFTSIKWNPNTRRFDGGAV